MMFRLPTAAVFLVVLAAAAAACGGTAGSAAPAPSGSASSVATGTARTAAASTVNVVITNDGCVPVPALVPAGAVTFNITNDGGDKVSEAELKQGDHTVAEKENLTPGLTGSFTVTLAAGSYIVECPGAATDETAFEVTAAE